MARYLLAVSLFACLSLAQSSPAIDERIAGGYAARKNQFPYQVAIYLHSNNVVNPLEDEFCSGSLISQNYVLTAAHCLAKADAVTVVLGGLRLDELESNQVTQNSSDFIIPEEFEAGKYVWDIGLIKLSEPVEFADNLQPAKLAEGDVGDYAGDVATVAGWGATFMTQYYVEPALRYVDDVIISYHQCTKENPFFRGVVVEGSNFCQLSQMKGACRGDSGAPLTLDGMQIGIVAFTPVNCFRDYHIIHTRVATYIDWVKEHSDY